jgi:TPP-dependent trihydroxycyclohexane-1,2-dione (THcHDO) dehydratase
MLDPAIAAGFPFPAAGRPGNCLRLPRRVLRADGARDPAAAPDRDRLAEAMRMLQGAKRPLIISGGGVRYSLAEEVVAAFAEKRGIPLAETIAGKSAVTHDHPAHVGPIGVIGSSSANALAAEADVILAIGTRLQDFTTGSWTAFSPDAKFISVNAARFDANKHRALAVVGDARETVAELDAALSGWQADPAWMDRGRHEFARWNAMLDDLQRPTNDPVPSYAQVVGLVNAKVGERDYMVTAAGGLPGETTKGWRVKSPTPLIASSASPPWATRSPAPGAPHGGSDAHPHRDDRRRQLPDDELRHLLVGADRPQADHRGVR